MLTGPPFKLRDTMMTKRLRENVDFLLPEDLQANPHLPYSTLNGLKENIRQLLKNCLPIQLPSSG